MSKEWLTERQLQAVNMLVRQGRGIIWWKVGEGKTRIALESYIRITQCRHKLLVVCSPEAFRTWVDEARLHPVYSKIIWMQFLSSGMLSTKGAGKIIGNILIDPRIGMIVVDELWMYKNISTLRSKEIKLLTSRLPAVGLSGSLITNRNIEDIYGQACSIGVGGRLAKNLTHFRSQFCVRYEDFGLKFTAKKGALEVIQRRLAPCCDVYFPKDVRETRSYRTTVDPTPEQLGLFDVCQNDYYAKLRENSEIEIRSAANLVGKLQQISDGVVLDSEGKRVSIESSKLARLLDILEEYADAGERAIIWFAFKASLEAVHQKLGKEATCLSSDHAFDSEGWRAGRYHFALATVGSGASLNDFANTQRAIIYSAPYSHRAMQQAMGRTNRVSSTHSVCYYQWLQTDRGVDKLVYDSLQITGEIEKSAIRTSAEVIRAYMETYGRKSFF